MSGVTVEVSARTFAVPFECPCCGAAPDTELQIAVKRTAGRQLAADSARSLGFPYCEHCVEHATDAESAGVVSAGVMVLGILAAVGIGLMSKLVIGVIALAAASLLAWTLAQARRSRARAGCGPSCSSPAKAVGYLGWSGTTSAFMFDSPTYTARFAEQNTRDLVNVSGPLRKLIEGHKLARLAVPTPASPVTVASAPPTAGEWIAKIEATRGAVARRNTFSRALDGLHDAAERTQILDAVTAIELAGAVARIDGLTSAEAKRREVRRAIAAIRADNLPAELRDAELRELERRLAAL